MDEFQVDFVPRREGRWVAGLIERQYNNKQLMMGGGSMEKVTEKDPETVETGGGVGLKLVLSIATMTRSGGVTV